MSPEERFIYGVLMAIHQRKHGAAVKTREVAPKAYYSERAARLHLARLADRGLVARRGSRGGWLPVMAICEPTTYPQTSLLFSERLPIN